MVPKKTEFGSFWFVFIGKSMPTIMEDYMVALVGTPGRDVWPPESWKRLLNTM